MVPSWPNGKNIRTGIERHAPDFGPPRNGSRKN